MSEKVIMDFQLVKLRAECKQLSAKLREKDDEARHMVRLAEERRYVSNLFLTSLYF